MQGKEALAYCWQNSKGYYLCDGPNQQTQVGDKDVDGPLKLVRCDNYRRKRPFDEGTLYY